MQVNRRISDWSELLICIRKYFVLQISENLSVYSSMKVQRQTTLNLKRNNSDCISYSKTILNENGSASILFSVKIL